MSVAVSIVIPARDEGDHIVPVLDRIFDGVASECRVIVVPRAATKPNPFAAIGFAKRHGLASPHRTTAEAMKELREGEER